MNYFEEEEYKEVCEVRRSNKILGASIKVKIEKEKLERRLKELNITQNGYLFFIQAVDDELNYKSYDGETIKNIRRREALASGLHLRLSASGWGIDIDEYRDAACTNIRSKDPRYVFERIDSFEAYPLINPSSYNNYVCYHSEVCDNEIRFGDQPENFIDQGDMIEGTCNFSLGLFFDEGSATMRTHSLIPLGIYLNWGIRIEASTSMKDGFYIHRVTKTNLEETIDTVPQGFQSAADAWNEHVKSSYPELIKYCHIESFSR